MPTDPNSFANRMLDTLASAFSFFFGAGETTRVARGAEVPESRPPIADIDLRIAISATGFHYVHAVVDNEFVFTATSQKGGLIPIDRTLTPLDLFGNVDRRVSDAVTALIDAHADWARAGRPQQAFDKPKLDKIERKLDASGANPRKPLKQQPVHSVDASNATEDGIALAEMRDFFLQQPTNLLPKRPDRTDDAVRPATRK